MELSRFSAKMTKIMKKLTESKNFGRKIFWVGIDSECFKTYFKPKILKSNIFSRLVFLLGLCRFLPDMTKVVKKWQSKKFSRIFFSSESIQNVSKRILNWKSRNRKFFPVWNYFRGTLFFSAKMTKLVKKWKSQKFLSKICFGPNRFRMFQNVF